MSTIETNPVAAHMNNVPASRTGRSGGVNGTFGTVGTPPDSNAGGDTVEISDAARELLQNNPLGNGGLDQPWKPYSAFEIEEYIAADSKEHKEYRELLTTVRDQRSGVMSRIESLLRDNGISLQGQGKMKIEIDSKGNVVVGGLEDKELAKKIEEKLNQDRSLVQDIKDFQKNEKDLSALTKKYTGVNLYELTQTASGDINKRIRDTVNNPDASGDYFTNLAFLGDASHVINRNDVDSLSFNGPIDFSGEIDTTAQPEKNIRDSMKDLGGKIKEQFAAENKALIERLEEAGIELTEETKAKMLDLSGAKVTVDNQGAVVVEGKLSGNEAAHRKGVEIIEKLAREMLNDFDSNSYHVSLFTDASERLLELRGEGKTDWNNRVVAELVGGSVGGIQLLPFTPAR